MQHRRALSVAFTFLLMGFVLTGCKTSEERAETHFQSAQERLETGDLNRAIVELRNVLKFNENHQEGRRLFANVLEQQGKLGQAYKQYTRLVEQFPEDVEGLRFLSAASLTERNWEAAERYVPRGYALMPKDIQFQAMQTLLDYRAGRENEDTDQILAAVLQAQTLLETHPDQLSARETLIDHFLVEGQWRQGLTQIDAALAESPLYLEYHEVKLQTLTALQDSPAIGTHLEDMVRLFPDNPRIQQLLIAWYVENNLPDKAEDFLRQLAENASAEDKQDANGEVIQFIARNQGRPAAMIEIDRLINAGEAPLYYKSLRASLLFDQGQRAQGMQELEAAIAETQDPPAATLHDSKVALAHMLIQTGEITKANTLVNEVLTQNGNHVRALQLQASRLIEEDKPSAAIQALRTALDQDPRNAATLSLMAQAHMRDGNKTLAGERLALAVEASNRAPEESLRYAQFLSAENRLDSAEAILTDALRRNPNHLRLLQNLGQLYLWESDWTRANEVIRHLARLNSTPHINAAQSLQTALVLRQRSSEEGQEYIQRLIDSGDSSNETLALLIRTQISAGDWDAAQATLQEALKTSNDTATLRFIQAALNVASGRLDEAEATYTELLDENPQEVRAVLAYENLLRRTDRAAEADALLDRAFAAYETPPTILLWTQARSLEQRQDFEGAIGVYETLYETDSNNAILANNLASMLASYRQDEDSLQRAYVIARRLRGTNVPEFQDTYGWIEYRRGNPEEALKYLEPAAETRPEDALISLHLGLTHAALGNSVQARDTLTQALVRLTENGITIPSMSEAQSVLQSLPQAPAE